MKNFLAEATAPVVTPEMIKAGRNATRVEDDCPPDELMARIYRAMRVLEPQTEPPSPDKEGARVLVAHYTPITAEEVGS